MKIYAGNLSYEVTEEDLRQEFLAYGEVTSVSIITDRISGRPKGFGFVEMASNHVAIQHQRFSPLDRLNIRKF